MSNKNVSNVNTDESTDNAIITNETTDNAIITDGEGQIKGFIIFQF